MTRSDNVFRMRYAPRFVRVPDYPLIEPKDAVDTLLQKEWSERGVRNRTIRNLHEVLDLFARRNPDPHDYQQAFFQNVVVESASVDNLTLRFMVLFDDALFREDLSFEKCHGPKVLGIDGGVLERLSIDLPCGQTHVNLARIELESIYVARGEVSGVNIDTSAIASLMLVEVRVGSVFVMQSELGGPVHLQGVAAEEISFHQTNLLGGLTVLQTNCAKQFCFRHCVIHDKLWTGSSTCSTLCLADTVCHRTVSLQGLTFGEIDLCGARLDGGLLAKRDQLRRTGRGDRVRTVWRGDWDTPSRVVGDDSCDEDALRSAADQLLTLREAFRRTPSTSAEEDYCAYRLMEAYRRITTTPGLGALNKFLFGYLLLPARVFRTILLAVLFFAALFAALHAVGAGDIVQTGDVTGPAHSVFSDGNLAGILRCVYFSTITITTVAYGDMHPTCGLKAIAVFEALSGVCLGALFVVCVARRLFRW